MSNSGLENHPPQRSNKVQSTMLIKDLEDFSNFPRTKNIVPSVMPVW